MWWSDGRPLVLTATPNVQLPGEFLLDALVDELTDGDGDLASKLLLDEAVFYVVPLVCPDGAFRGHLRTNALGVNLNRIWHQADPKQSPEV